MTAVLLNGHGGFDRLEVCDDVAVPEPRSHEVLVQVSAAGVNNTDLNTRIGWYAPDALPTTDADAAVLTARADVGWSGDVPTFPR
ncbi:MAG: alcohol dehydrogenase, partial [Ilumatobacteraceae bacterium]